MEATLTIALVALLIFIAVIIIGKAKGAPNPLSMSDQHLVSRRQSEMAWIDRFNRLPQENQNSQSLKNMYAEKTAYIKEIELEIIKREKGVRERQSKSMAQPSMSNETLTEEAFRAADAGNVSAQAMVGISYIAGKNGVGQDYQKGAAYLLKAAEQGHMPSCLVVAGLYAEGDGFQADLVKARFWAEKAKALGHPDADDMLRGIDAKPRA